MSTLFEKTENIASGIYQLPTQIMTIDENKRAAILCLWLTYACDSSNIANIVDGRSRIHLLPENVIQQQLLDCVEKTLDLNDEWQYRRLLELVAHWPDFLRYFIRQGQISHQADILEACEDFKHYLPNGTRQFCAVN